MKAGEALKRSGEREKKGEIKEKGKRRKKKRIDAGVEGRKE